LKNDRKKIALIGNPNAGKSTLYNVLTGLRQKTGNFPGVTVDKKSGRFRLPDHQEVELIDLPGIYSLYPRSIDEAVVVDILANPTHPDYPDLVVIVADAANLKRNLLLFTELHDLGLPIILALNMLDVADEMGITVNAVQLSMQLGVPVVKINARTGEGKEHLHTAIQTLLAQTSSSASPRYFQDPSEHLHNLIGQVKERFGLENSFKALLYLTQHERLTSLSEADKHWIVGQIQASNFEKTTFLSAETVRRYTAIQTVVDKAVQTKGTVEQPAWTRRLDRWLLHPVWGYALFGLVLLLIFQAIFAWAQWPMDVIDGTMASLIEWTKATLPAGLLTDLLTDGLLAGIGGVVVFIPQIALLFGLVALLEESGYMARVMVIMDALMRRFGLNGKSVVPLISGVACAVPAVMSARSINNPYERLLTVLVTPLMSCSARLPIYIILIALVVPDEPILGVFNQQGLVLFGLYLLGLVGALFSAWLLSLFIKRTSPSYFVMEMPTYKLPRWQHIGLSMYESVRSFVVEAGKIIVAISIVLWVLASYGPGDSIEQATAQVKAGMATASEAEQEAAISAARLEASYAGRFGKFLEPAIQPLGYDWKIGIALITSFAAREVFVGTMATIYSLGSDSGEDVLTVKERLKSEINPKTGGPMYTPAVSYSLLVFYVFAMMCMSTLAAVYRETKGWKWPLIQLVYLFVLAYGSAFVVYQWLS
jgi:ferrous iron transport protein B